MCIQLKKRLTLQVLIEISLRSLDFYIVSGLLLCYHTG